MTIHAQRFADIPNLVCEGHFQRVKAITDVLHHLRGFDWRHESGASMPNKADAQFPQCCWTRRD